LSTEGRLLRAVHNRNPAKRRDIESHTQNVSFARVRELSRQVTLEHLRIDNGPHLRRIHDSGGAAANMASRGSDDAVSEILIIFAAQLEKRTCKMGPALFRREGWGARRAPCSGAAGGISPVKRRHTPFRRRDRRCRPRPGFARRRGTMG
jgi:hypothetical protein